ncbi:MAG: CRISPR-associated endonuclease Cas2 [Nitrososphaerota archaeon]|jgi:CRISPR-associated protein Cas2|nr:CRISPR-associated endonuclease Cas2 [Nitrososphaerota archaeon]MDG7037940.1 CRISPR-associated endonuclease Cas2 [Nitrososphaerota archaeon]
MRNKYLVAYDISDSKRLRMMYNLMCGYGDPLQFSVFLCELSGKEKVLMATDIISTINKLADSVLLVNLGNSQKDKAIEFIGHRKQTLERKPVII